MALPPSHPDRHPRHRRTMEVEVFGRPDGRWEVLARLVDLRLPGTPIHDMQLGVVLDEDMNVIEAGSRSDVVPFPGHCEPSDEMYGQLVGLNLLKGFAAGVQARLGRALGCTHLNELSQVLPTVVVQALSAAELKPRRKPSGASGSRPFFIDGCHALRSDGEAVRVHYPKWFRQPHATQAPDGAPAVSAAGDVNER